ncbi:MAG: phage terminase large subunit [Phycisphaerae bacterium]
MSKSVGQPAARRARTQSVRQDTQPGAESSLDPPALRWAQRFLPHYFSDAAADFHRELLADLEDGDKRLIARVAPRGHAKSTCAALAFPLYCICLGLRRNIVILTHESSLAVQFVRDIRHELETNDQIRAAYGDLTASGVAPAAARPRARRKADVHDSPKRKAAAAHPRVSKSEPPNSARARRTNRSPTRAARATINGESTRDALREAGESIPAAAPRRRWREAYFTTSTGITVQAKGSGAGFRGTRVGPNRPDLIICDDIEKDALVDSSEARAKLERWLRRVVMPALAPDGRLLVLGSMLHYDSLLANLRDKQRFPRWDYRVYRALDAQPTRDGAFALTALWPARWPVERLQAERERIGTLAFEQEYQANPVDDHVRVFRPEWLRKTEIFSASEPRAPATGVNESGPSGDKEPRAQASGGGDVATLDAPNSPGGVVASAALIALMAVDPATGVSGGDFFALWGGGVDPRDGRIHSRELLLRRVGIVEQVRLIVEAFERHRPVKIGIETTAYQVALKDVLDEYGRRNGIYLPIVAIRASTNKRARIEGSAPFFENGTFLLPAALDPEVESQFLHFPKARHDDAPDVCAMAIELARSLRSVGSVEGETRGARLFTRRGGW